ncbi:MAG: phage Gp37/Gp68 family protein [Xanthobacteraceae bacterium]|nr:phage Gp37/Gp68 family protein [Xanthobacteraceae bacterium]
MANNSRIEWTEATWNPVAGCAVISPGCTNCYAMRLAARLGAMGQEKYQGTTRKSGGRAKWNGVIRLDTASLEIPRRWKTGKLIFVNSMSDLFHEDVPLEYISRVFKTMNETSHHTYQVLTKRAERLKEVSKFLTWTPNIWMGVSVENQDYAWRIDHLRETDAEVKFLSLEPLLGPLDQLNLSQIDWVIVGGESGPGARQIQENWVRSIHHQCQSSRVAFHFKQWGGVNKKKSGRMLDGRTWDGMPTPRAEGPRLSTS